MTHAAAVELLDALHRAQAGLYEREDTSPVAELLSSDVTWTVPGASPIAGHYAGINEVIQYMLARARFAGHTFRMHRRAVMVGDGFTAALTDGEAVVSERVRRWSTIGVYETDGQMITSCRLLPFDQQEFDQIWTPADS